LNLIEEDFEGLICLVQNIKSKKIEKAQLKNLTKIRIFGFKLILKMSG
jgi:hypothetical protein